MKAPKHVRLSSRETCRLSDLSSRRLSFSCLSGTAWITTPGDRKDYILQSGQSVSFEMKSRRDQLVIQNVSQSKLELDVFDL